MQRNYKIIGFSIMVTVLVLYYIFYGMRVRIMHPDTYHDYYSKNLFNVFREDCREYTCKSEKPIYKKTRIASADPKTFEVLSDHYTKDKDNVYVCSNGLDYKFKIKCEIIENADTSSFSAIGTTGSAIYAKDKNYVYMLEKVIKNADPQSFSLVNDFANYIYAKDKNFVYKSGQIIQGADPATFSLVRHNGSLDNAHARDKNFVYKSGEIIDGADPSTFSLVDIYDERYAKDANHVYLSGKTIENADPLLFSLVGDKVYSQRDYAKDANHVYLSGKTIENADPLSFSLVGDELIDGRDHTYAKDANHVYRSGEIIKDADSSTFSLIYLNTNQDYSYVSYAKDKSNVYVFGKVIENADPQTFHMIDEEYIRTKNSGGFSRFAVDSNSIYFTDYDGNLYRVRDIQSVSDLDYFFSVSMEQFLGQRREHTIFLYYEE